MSVLKTEDEIAKILDRAKLAFRHEGEIDFQRQTKTERTHCPQTHPGRLEESLQAEGKRCKSETQIYKRKEEN